MLGEQEGRVKADHGRFLNFLEGDIFEVHVAEAVAGGEDDVV